MSTNYNAACLRTGCALFRDIQKRKGEQIAGVSGAELPAAEGLVHEY